MERSPAEFVVGALNAFSFLKGCRHELSCASFCLGQDDVAAETGAPLEQAEEGGAMDHDAPQQQEEAIASVQAGADMLEEVPVAEAFLALSGATSAEGTLGAGLRPPCHAAPCPRMQQCAYFAPGPWPAQRVQEPEFPLTKIVLAAQVAMTLLPIMTKTRHRPWRPRRIARTFLWCTSTCQHKRCASL